MKTCSCPDNPWRWNPVWRAWLRHRSTPQSENVLPMKCPQCGDRLLPEGRVERTEASS